MTPPGILGMQRTAGNAAVNQLVQRLNQGSPPSLQRANGGGVATGGIDTEFTWEKEVAKDLTFRCQGKLVYDPAKGPVKLSKGLFKITKKAGKNASGALAGRAASIDPLSTSLADDFIIGLGLDPETVKGTVGIDIKLMELDVKGGSRRGTVLPNVSLMKVEVKVSVIDLTDVLSSLSPELASALQEAKNAGHEIRIIGQIGLQYNVPVAQLAARNPYLAAAMVGAAAGLGVTYMAVKANLDALGEVGEVAASAGSAAEATGTALVRAMETAVYRPAFEVLVMADPQNMEFDDEVTDDEIGIITDIGYQVQERIWSSTEVGSALKVTRLPMSNFASKADMESIARAGRRIGLLKDSQLTPAALLQMVPAGFFERLESAGLLTWMEDPTVFLEDIEDRYMRGQWRPSVAG